MEPITYYESNPNLQDLVVTTHDGKKEYRINCKKIKGSYYVKDVTCFHIDGQWFRIDSGLISFDHSVKKWILNKNNHMIKGIVSFEKDGSYTLGTFTPNPTKNIVFEDSNNGNRYIILDESVGNGMIRERLCSGIYYITSKHGDAFFDNLKNIVNHKDKGYNIEDNVDEYTNKKKVFDEYPLKINNDVIRYSRYLEDVTFGAELEAIVGYLPDHIQYQTGTVICRDGSLHANDGSQGPEYTTIPMSGAKGVQALINLCKELTKRNIVDHHCSLHFHIGNLPTSRLFIVSLYKLAVMIQDDLFKMFPFYKNDEPRYANKDKNYCAKLDQLGQFNLRNDSKDAYESYIYDNFIRIFSFLSGNVAPSKTYNRTNAVHPKNEKWNRKARYHWLNLLNTIFSKRNTVEFRIHQGTTNPQKVISWLFICNAIVKTAMLESHRILKGETITFKNVLDYYGKFYKTTTSTAISVYLNDYYDSRVREFEELKDNEDFLGIKEVNADKTFEFVHSSFTKMFK